MQRVSGGLIRLIGFALDYYLLNFCIGHAGGIIVNYPRFILTFSLIFLLICCGEKESEYPVTIETVDGVQVVTNPDFPRDGTIAFEMIEEISIGGDVEDEDYVFHKPYDVKVAGDGKIFVLDWGDSTIKIYDDDGQYIRTIGGRGQGPGEFEGLVFFSIGSDGNVYVQDSMNHRVAVLDEQGEYIAGFRIEDGLPYEFATDRKNFIYSGIQFQDDEVRRLRILRFNAAGEEITDYGLFQLVQPVITKRTQNTVSSTMSRHAATTVWTVDQEGKLYAGYGDKYQISVFDPEGNLFLKFGREFTPVENKLAGKPGQPDRIGVFNVINRRWLFDESNNIWVEMFIKDDPEEIVYDVFSPEGIYLRQIKVKHRISQIFGGKAYGFVRDEVGFVSVKRFKLVEITG